MDRKNNIKKISKIVKKKIAQQIEESIYLFSVAYTEEADMAFLLESIYSDKFNEIYNLLLNNKFKFLINALESKKIDPTKIAYMRPDELNPNKYEKIIKKKEIEDFKKKNVPTSSAYKCPKCKESKITITQKQTRAADEPATVYMECNVCGYITINNN